MNTTFKTVEEISRGTNKVQSMTLSLNIAFTHFGLILFKGPVMVMQLVSEWLERRFDCRICHLIFQRFELRKIVESSLEISYNQPQGHSKYFLIIMDADNIFFLSLKYYPFLCHLS